MNLLQSKALSYPNNVTSYYHTPKYTHFVTILSYVTNNTRHLNFYFIIHCLLCKTVKSIRINAKISVHFNTRTYFLYFIYSLFNSHQIIYFTLYLIKILIFFIFYSHPFFHTNLTSTINYFPSRYIKFTRFV